MPIRTALVTALCLISFQNFAQGIPEYNTINRFLKSYNYGSYDSIKKFIDNNYVQKTLDDLSLKEKFIFSFGALYDEFGPLELYSTSYDTTYKSVKYHLKGTYTNEWASIMFLIDTVSGKIRGQGLWKLQTPEKYEEQKVSQSNLSDYLDQYLSQLSSHTLFSGVVFAANSNGILYNKAFGYKNQSELNNPNTVFPIASITKVFTALAIMQLIEKGLLDINSNIAQYIPEYPTDISSKVTIRHLLNHTSGIELDDCEEFNNRKMSVGNLDELVNLHVEFIDSLNEGRRFNFKPLDDFDYSNDGYDLLGAIIERAAGISYKEYLNKNIFEPAEMSNTSFSSDNNIEGYSRYNSEKKYDPYSVYIKNYFFPVIATPSGGLFSTTNDLYRFYLALNSKKFLKDNWRNIFTDDCIGKNKSDCYGYGIDVTNFNGYKGFGHNGGIIGASSEFRYFPELDLFFVILCNRERSAPDLLYHITRIFQK